MNYFSNQLNISAVKSLLLGIAVCASLYAPAQIRVGSTASLTNAGRQADMEKFKKTTTLFILQSKDYAHVQDFEKAIGSVWTITKFKIIKPEELNQYVDKEGYSFFDFTGMSGSMGVRCNPNDAFTGEISYDLWRPNIGRSGLFAGASYAHITLSLQPESYGRAQSVYCFKFATDISQFLHNDAVFDNWGAGFLRGYLKTINDLLASEKIPNDYMYYQDGDALKQLGQDTLYIPDYINVKYTMITQKVKYEEPDVKEMLESYPHNIRMVAGQELNDMIQTRNDDFCYLVYVRYASNKYVVVFHNKKGMVYGAYGTGNFKAKDLEKLNKALY